MRFPAYGNALWQRRLLNERPRCAQLLVGNFWRKNRWIPGDIPRLAVKTSPWHTPRGEQFDWRVIAGMHVVAIDVRDADEREEGADHWDAWLWLLAEVQRFASSVLMQTPTIALPDWGGQIPPEADLETYAFVNRTPNADLRTWDWPPWWPYGDTISRRRDVARAAA